MKPYALLTLTAGLVLAGGVFVHAADMAQTSPDTGTTTTPSTGGGTGTGAGGGTTGTGAGEGTTGTTGVPDTMKYRLFDQFDANNDGQLTEEELDQVVNNQWTRYNTDGQEGLTFNEFSPWFQNYEQLMMMRSFYRFDTNGDNVISQDEINELADEAIQKMDTDGDGALSRDEIGKRFERQRENGNDWGDWDIWWLGSDNK